MKQEVILVLDCGATNVRAIAVNRQGKIVARASTPNASDIAMENNTWHQWSLDAILQRFADCCRQINSELTECHIRGIAVTTFGVDGALVDKQGNVLYPIISWKCPRTAAVMDNIERLISAQQLQAISGVGAFSFNTLYKLVWLKENHPQLLERAHAWLFISSLINHRLTGEFTTDITMAGTSQMLDIQQRDFSPQMLVGGGSRNTLWNQIKANMLDIPVKVLDDAETTVAGAALFGWYGVGEFNSPEEARAQIHYQYRYFYPQTEPEFIEEV
ncbi:FGGY family carbohydrate kinase [Escherichia coli]